MASIGYIGGNYMNGANMNIDYPYDPSSNPYNFWKPSNGYYPRGEPPPAYDSIIQEPLAQTETVNAHCTVR